MNKMSLNNKPLTNPIDFDNQQSDALATPFHAMQDSENETNTTCTIDVLNSNEIVANQINKEENKSNKNDDDHHNTDSSLVSKWKHQLWHLYEKECLLIEVVLAILVAYCYPELGGEYLHPNITAHWIAVIIIFFCSGLALKIQEVSQAATNIKFNLFVLAYNFLGISSIINYVANFLCENDIVSEDLKKGMIICSCLSMPSNMMVILSVASKGDEAVALFLATVMNLLGVFITPLLIFVYMREAAEINFLNTYKSISFRVLLPVAVGLVMRVNVKGLTEYLDEKKVFFQKIREKALVFIVYATFCSTFLSPSDSSGGQILIMAVSQVILLISAMIIAWIMLFKFFNREPKLRVCGLFGCSTKTAAIGIPLISAIYEDHPKLGIYTLPLLIWYTAQLIIGTLISSRLARFVDYKLHKYAHESGGEQC